MRTTLTNLAKVDLFSVVLFFFTRIKVRFQTDWIACLPLAETNCSLFERIVKTDAALGLPNTISRGECFRRESLRNYDKTCGPRPNQ